MKEKTASKMDVGLDVNPIGVVSKSSFWNIYKAMRVRGESRGYDGRYAYMATNAAVGRRGR